MNDKIEKFKKIIRENNMVGKTYTVVEMLQLFGYSAKTNLIDTKLYHLVDVDGPYTSKTCNCRIKPESEWITARWVKKLI